MGNTPFPQTYPITINNIRDIGRKMLNQGMFEFNIISGSLTWANDFFLEKLGYTLEQFQTLTIFDITPSGFHDQIRNLIIGAKEGKLVKYFIWPGSTSDGMIAWWYIFKTEVNDPITWSHGDYVQTTETNGIAYVFMKVTMDTTNNYGQLQSHVSELDAWVKDQIHRLDESDQVHHQMIERLENKMQHAVDAATKAANTSLESSKKLNDTKEEIKTLINQLEDRFAVHAGEILKLIGDDNKQDQRIERIEKRIELATELAMDAISTQAKKASKGISRKVTIPVSAIAAFFTLLQWMLQNWGDVTKWFRVFKI
jgi:hypothetical protein